MNKMSLVLVALGCIVANAYADTVTYNLKVGESKIIPLASNYSIRGGAWEIKSNEPLGYINVDRELIVSNESAKPGAGSTDNWIFTAVKPGTAKVELSKAGEVKKTLIFNVTKGQSGIPSPDVTDILLKVGETWNLSLDDSDYIWLTTDLPEGQGFIEVNDQNGTGKHMWTIKAIKPGQATVELRRFIKMKEGQGKGLVISKYQGKPYKTYRFFVS